MYICNLRNYLGKNANVVLTSPKHALLCPYTVSLAIFFNPTMASALFYNLCSITRAQLRYISQYNSKCSENQQRKMSVLFIFFLYLVEYTLAVSKCYYGH